MLRQSAILTWTVPPPHTARPSGHALHAAECAVRHRDGAPLRPRPRAPHGPPLADLYTASSPSRALCHHLTRASFDLHSEIPVLPDSIDHFRIELARLSLLGVAPLVLFLCLELELQHLLALLVLVRLFLLLSAALPCTEPLLLLLQVLFLRLFLTPLLERKHVHLPIVERGGGAVASAGASVAGDRGAGARTPTPARRA